MRSDLSCRDDENNNWITTQFPNRSSCLLYAYFNLFLLLESTGVNKNRKRARQGNKRKQTWKERHADLDLLQYEYFYLCLWYFPTSPSAIFILSSSSINSSSTQ